MAQQNHYQEFNNFQTNFYTNIDKFNNHSRYDVIKHGYTLLNNLAKGFPNLSNIILNLKGLNWSGPTSPALLCALQRRFINGYSSVKIPQFIYFKNNKPVTTKTKEEKKEDSEIIRTVCNIYKFDTKSFEQLYNEKYVKETIAQLKGENEQVKNFKRTKKK